MHTWKWRSAIALAVLSLAIAGCQDSGGTQSVEDLPSISTESMGTESHDMSSGGASESESAGESEEASPSDDS
jgi:hypothetical protein